MNKLYEQISSKFSLAMLALLGASYLLCRYGLLGLHGMKQWPDIMGTTGAFILLSALVLRKRLMAAATAGGYLVSFFLGVLFNGPGEMPGTTTMWQIWMTSYFVIIMAGSIADLFFKRIAPLFKKE